MCFIKSTVLQIIRRQLFQILYRDSQWKNPLSAFFAVKYWMPESVDQVPDLIAPPQGSGSVHYMQGDVVRVLGFSSLYISVLYCLWEVLEHACTPPFTSIKMEMNKAAQRNCHPCSYLQKTFEPLKKCTWIITSPLKLLEGELPKREWLASIGINLFHYSLYIR